MTRKIVGCAMIVGVLMLGASGCVVESGDGDEESVGEVSAALPFYCGDIDAPEPCCDGADHCYTVCMDGCSYQYDLCVDNGSIPWSECWSTYEGCMYHCTIWLP
jgi:hypothetical protein